MKPSLLIRHLETKDPNHPRKKFRVLPTPWSEFETSFQTWLLARLCVNYTYNCLNWLSEFCFRCHNISAREVFQY